MHQLGSVHVSRVLEGSCSHRVDTGVSAAPLIRANRPCEPKTQTPKFRGPWITSGAG